MLKRIILFQIIIVSLLFVNIAVGGNKMQISSSDFIYNGDIPKTFTCQGNDINPNLIIEGIPEGTKSLALIVDDPDAPMGMWVHWVVYNISPEITSIPEDTIPGIQGYNTFGRENYGGPCPPNGKHRYFFKLYALDKIIDVKKKMSKEDLEAEMEGHIIENSEIIGLYEKH